MIFNLFKPKFTFYILTCDIESNKILTITNNKEQCYEFYHRYLRQKHFHCFSPWCIDRDLDVNAMASWYRYYNECVNSAEAGTYKVAEMTFTNKELAALLRALTQTELLGCEYESAFDREIRILS